MNSCKSHIFISFPCMGIAFDEELIFSESVSQLVQRILSQVGFTNTSIFNLYGYSKSFRKIQPTDSCQNLFASEYERFVIIQSNLDVVDIYFENAHEHISYSKNMPASNLVETANYCFAFTNEFSFYVLFDPITNSLISMNEPSTSSALIVKQFDTIIPGMIFNLDRISSFVKAKGIKSFTIYEISMIIFTNSMNELFRQIYEQRNLSFNITLLSFEQAQKCEQSFKTESFISDLTHDEKTTFLFTLLSSGKNALVSPDLQQLAVNTMKAPDDITKLEMTKVFLMYIPFSTHIILFKLVQIYGGGYMDQENRNKAITILTETIFRRFIDRDIEREFISFMFLFYQYLFPSEKNTDSKSKICVYDKKLVLFDTLIDQQIHAFTTDGPTDITIEQTTPLDHNPPIKELLDKYVIKAKDFTSSNQGETENAAQECIEIYKRINQKLKENYPKKVLYPFCEYLDELNFDDHKIIS